MHDEITTDRNNPTVNGGGPVYAVSAGHGALVILDPKTHRTEELEIPDARAARKGAVALPAAEPAVVLLRRHASVVEPAVQPGRSAQPDARQQGARVADDQDSRQPEPGVVLRSSQQVRGLVPAQAERPPGRVLRPATKQFTLVDTCYATHHLYFDTDANETVYFNELCGPMVGWVDTKVSTRRRTNRRRLAGAARSLTPTATAGSRARGTSARPARSPRCMLATPPATRRAPRLAARGGGSAARSEARYADQLQPVWRRCRVPPTTRCGAPRKASPATSSASTAAATRRSRA